MSKSNAFETALLQLLFNNQPIPLIGDAAGILGSAVGGSLYVSLHTADPGEAGTQATSEVAYTGYARVAVERTADGWTVTGGSVSPTETIEFPMCSGGTATVTHFGIGAAAAGAGLLLYKGPVTPTIAVANGVTPRLLTTSSVTEE